MNILLYLYIYMNLHDYIEEKKENRVF